MGTPAVRAAFGFALLIGIGLSFGAVVQGQAPAGRPPAPAPAAPASAGPTTVRRQYIPPTIPGGQTDLRGIWQALNGAAWDILDHGAALYPGLPARFSQPAGVGVVVGNELPYQPWARTKQQENFKNRATADPEAQCYLPGVPRITYQPHPFQIFQSPDRVIILYEYLHTIREIPLDGSPHLEELEFWMGDSRGKWDRGSLVVDVTLFTDQTWFDRSGNFHSPEMHLVERFTRTGPDVLQYEATIEDPTVFTRPWTMRMPIHRRTDPRAQILEFECYALMREASNATR